jgi:peptidoglycan/xylan/chitin deacetylase (PgdA/CDA1 family)
MPAKFELARLFGPPYALRCVVFHNVVRQTSPFTKGIWVDITPEDLETKLKFLAANYTPVHLDDVVAAAGGATLPSRAVLVTFDDAYASIAEVAAPLCAKYRVPAVFFVNAAFLDNATLAPDNLVCYVVNVHGMAPVREAVGKELIGRVPMPASLGEVFSRLFPALSLEKRQRFLDELARAAGLDPARMAAEARLYMTREQLSSLASFGFEVGDHTYTHVHCRTLRGGDFARELATNRARLEAACGRPVRSFSLPYGSSADFTPELERYLRQTGYTAVFFSESVANGRRASLFHLDRVSTRTAGDAGFFLEMEVLPRLRVVRNHLFPPQVPATAEAS